MTSNFKGKYNWDTGQNRNVINGWDTDALWLYLRDAAFPPSKIPLAEGSTPKFYPTFPTIIDGSWLDICDSYTSRQSMLRGRNRNHSWISRRLLQQIMVGSILKNGWVDQRILPRYSDHGGWLGVTHQNGHQLGLGAAGCWWLRESKVKASGGKRCMPQAATGAKDQWPAVDGKKQMTNETSKAVHGGKLYDEKPMKLTKETRTIMKKCLFKLIMVTLINDW